MCPRETGKELVLKSLKARWLPFLVLLPPLPEPWLLLFQVVWVQGDYSLKGQGRSHARCTPELMPPAPVRGLSHDPPLFQNSRDLFINSIWVWAEYAKALPPSISHLLGSQAKGRHHPGKGTATRHMVQPGNWVGDGKANFIKLMPLLELTLCLNLWASKLCGG